MAKKPTTKKAPTEKKPSLDIKDEMYHADRKNYNWLSEQPEELAKTFSPLVAMKWFSVCDGGPDMAEYHLLMTNEVVNVGFWDLSKNHPDLQWRLMCAAGSGVTQRHGWIPMASKKKSLNKVDSFLLGYHPHLSDEEIMLLRGKFSVEDFQDYVRGTGMPEAEVKPLVAEFKKLNG